MLDRPTEILLLASTLVTQPTTALLYIPLASFDVLQFCHAAGSDPSSEPAG